MILTKKVVLGVVGLATAGVLGTAGVAAATSDNSTPAPAASAAPSPGASAAPGDKSGDKKDRKHKVRRVALARGMHGEFVAKGKDGKPVTFETIRGTVTAVGPTSVTVKAEDGFTETFTANSDTKVRGGDVKTISAVKVGAKGAVIGVKAGNTITARVVLVRK